MFDLHDNKLFCETFQSFPEQAKLSRADYRISIDYRTYPDMPHNIALVLIKRTHELSSINVLFCNSHSTATRIAAAILTHNVGFSNHIFRDMPATRENFFKKVSASSPWFEDLFLWNKI